MIFYFYRYSDVKRIKVDENIEIKITKKPPSRRKEVLLKIWNKRLFFDDFFGYFFTIFKGNIYYIVSFW